MNCCWSLFLWGLVLAVAAALLVGGYLYFRLDDEIRRHVERTIAEHYPHLVVRVDKTRFEQHQGIAIYGLSVEEPQSSDSAVPMLVVDELHLVCDTRVEELLSGQPTLEQIVVRRPRLHVSRLADGGWNLQSLWPLPKLSDQTPDVHIEDATLTLSDASRSGVGPLTLRGIDVKLTPLPSRSATAPAAGTPAPAAVAQDVRRIQVVGTATGTPARQLTFTGTIGPDDGWLDLVVKIGALDVSPELMAAVPSFPRVGGEMLQLFGTADVTVRVSRAAASNAPLEWSADLRLTRGRLDGVGLPQSLTDLVVELHADPRRLLVERLTGKLGTASVAVACERHGWQARAPLSLAGKVVDLTVGAELQALLPDTLKRIWQRFQPAGTVDAELKLTFDGRRWRPELTAECRGVSLTDAEKFPYRLEKSTGTLKLLQSTASDHVELHVDLVAMGAGRPIEITARYDLPDPLLGTPRTVTLATSVPRKPVGWLEVSGSGIPIHEQLLAALPDKAEPFVRSLAPTGTIDFRWRTERTNPAQLRGDTALDLTLAGCAMRYDRFPYPLEQIKGRVTARNGLWTLDELTSRDRQGSATVTCRGTALQQATGVDVQLVFQGAGVPLDDNLRRAVSPRVQQAWAELRPQGRVDFTANVTRQAGQAEPVVGVELRPHQQTVSVTPTFFPYRFEEVDGRAIISGGKVSLQQVHARHGRSAFSAQGSWQPTGDGGWQLVLSDLNADWLSTEPDVLAALPPGLRRVVERLRPTGSFDLFRSTLSFVRRASGLPIAVTWDVNVGCHQASLRGDLPLESFSGGVRFQGASDGIKTRCYGELSADSLVWHDVQLTNVRGPFWADREYCLFGQPAIQRLASEQLVPAEQLTEPRRITADLYGGYLAADIQLQHAGHTHYRADISVGGVQLQRIARERFGGPEDLSGTISGKLALTGAGRSTYALTGGGELHVVDANIYKLRPLVALLKVLRSRAPDTTAFNRCDMQFRIRGEDIDFQQLDLLGDALSLYGRGQANFDQQLNLVFYTLVGPGKLPVPLLDTIVSQISEQSLQLKVTGPLENPNISREALPEVNKMLQQIRNAAEEGASAVTAPAAAAVPWAPQPR